MSDASVSVIDGRAVVRVGGSELLDPIVAGAAVIRDQTEDFADAGAASAALSQAKSVEASQYAAAASALANRFPTYVDGNAATPAGQDFTVVDSAGGWINVYRKGTSTGADNPLIQLPGKAGYQAPGGAAMIGTADGRSLQQVLGDVRVIPLQRYLADPNLPNATAAVQAWANALKASAPCIGAMNGWRPRVNEIDLTDMRNVIIDGGGKGGLLPIDGVQTSGRFVGRNLGAIAFRNGRTDQQAGYHWKPAFDLYGDSSGPARIDHWHFEGCGYGARFQTFLGGGADYCTGHQIGIYPRPAPLDPSADGYNEAFEVYGAAIRFTFTPGAVFGDHNDFRNDLPAGGHTGDQTGGAGFYTMHACDGGKFGASYGLNSPGQTFLGSGEWQGMDVVGQVLAGTFDYNLRGKDYLFDGCRGEGANQENCTAYGALRPKFINVRSRNGRFTSLEAWQCVDPIIIGGEYYEEESALHPTPGASGDGAIHIVECYNYKVVSPLIKKARTNGIRVDGSIRGEISNPTVVDYGADNLPNFRSSGVAFNVGLFGRRSTDGAVHGGMFAPAAANTNGGDLFAANSDQVLHQWGNRNPTRTLKFAGADAAFRGQPQIHTGAPVLIGGTHDQPVSKVYPTNRAVHIGNSASPIFRMLPIVDGQRDGYLVLVTGAMDSDPGIAFTDLVIVINGGTAQKIGPGDRVGPAAATTYSVSGEYLLLSLSAGAASIRCTVIQTLTGSQYIGLV